MKLPFNPRYIFKNIAMLYRAYGLTFPFIVLMRICEYTYCILFRSGTFTLDGREYHYFFHLENPTFRIERCVEIPLALEYVNRYPPEDVLEVGNVLANYIRVRHDVVDKYEKDSAVKNEDIVDYNPGRKYGLIVGISTLEHVGWDEEPREKNKVLRALANMKSLLKPGGEMLVTMPLGWNADLDALLREGKLGLDKLSYLKRISKQNQWRQATYDEVKDVKYGAPYLCGNAIVIGYYRAPPADDRP